MQAAQVAVKAVLKPVAVPTLFMRLRIFLRSWKQAFIGEVLFWTS